MKNEETKEGNPTWGNCVYCEYYRYGHCQFYDKIVDPNGTCDDYAPDDTWV